MLTVRNSSEAQGIKSSDKEDKVQVGEHTVGEGATCLLFFSFHFVRRYLMLKWHKEFCYRNKNEDCLNTLSLYL